MRRLSGRQRSALIIGLQGIRARKTRTLLSMISLFLGVLAVVVVQAGASIAERALLSRTELTTGIDGTRLLAPQGDAAGTAIILDTVRGRADATAQLTTNATIGEPGVTAVNPGASPLDQNWGGGVYCDPGQACPAPPPQGQAVEIMLTALTSDVRVFRPFPQKSGRWLAFGTVPGLSPHLVLNEEAAKAFRRYRVPAQLHVAGASADITPQFIGVVDDGDQQPHAYLRLDEISTWLPGASMVSSPQGGGQISVLLAPSTPVEKVLSTRLNAAKSPFSVTTVAERKNQAGQLSLFRWVFLGMAALVLLIGVAGILNVGLATVGERIEEFALRRAVGTPRSLLAGIVLAETLLTGLLTAAAAIGAGAAALRVVSALAGPSEPLLRNVQFPWEAGVAGITAGLAAGILGGFIPALRAARIPIAAVMRA